VNVQRSLLCETLDLDGIDTASIWKVPRQRSGTRARGALRRECIGHSQRSKCVIMTWCYGLVEGVDVEAGASVVPDVGVVVLLVPTPVPEDVLFEFPSPAPAPPMIIFGL